MYIIVTCRRSLKTAIKDHDDKGERAMNENIYRISEEICKIESLIKAYEKSYLDYTVSEEDRERYNRGVYCFYAISDAVEQAKLRIEETLSGKSAHSKRT